MKFFTVENKFTNTIVHNLRQVLNLLQIVVLQKIFNSLIPLFCVLFSACNVTQFLEKDHYIVRNNQVKIENISQKKIKKDLQYELATLYKQKDLPNSIIGKRKNAAWFYFKSQLDSNPSRIRRWEYKNFAKAPALFNAAQTDSTVSNMKRYLKNKGFLYPTVFYDKDFHNKDKGFADVTYHIDAGTMYVLDTVNFVCTDTTIQYLLSDTRENSFLKRGDPLSAELYERERARITETLNNFGYARFTSNYVSQLDADTIDTGVDARGNRNVNITVTVQVPADKKGHLRFYTADVIIYPNYDARLGETILKDTIVDGKIFFTYDGVIGIKPQLLSKAITLTPSTLYNKEITDKTVRQLTNLGLYKFVNVKPNIEECDSTLITYKIYLTPLKKMSYEAGLDVNYSNISTSFGTGTGNLGRVGLAVDFGFEHKNIFKGAERFRTSFSAGIDKGLSGSDQNNGLSEDIRGDMTLSIPKFVNLSRSWKLYDKTRIIKKSFFDDLKRNASTDYNIGYALSDRLGLNQYRLQQFNLGVRYILKKDNNFERFNINPTSIELILGELTDTFANRIDQRAKFSFQSQLMTGLVFRSFGYDFVSKPNKFNEKWQYIFNIEQSGSEVYLINKALKPNDIYRINNKLDFSKYWRVEFDVRYTKQYTTKRAYAARVAFGLAVPFADASSAPYSRLFSVGGPNSIRAWVVRQLGPGSYQYPQGTKIVPFQAGDIKFEFNTEYRFPAFWRIESAIFLDGGNIWNLKETLPGSKFTKFWYAQLAIGTGIALRLDVTYALIRLDFGYKLRSPYTIEGQSQWIGLSKWDWSNFNPNFGLGLPF